MAFFILSPPCTANAPPSPLPKPYAASHLPLNFNKFTSCPSSTATKTSSIVCTLFRESTRHRMGLETKDSELVVLQRPGSFGRFEKFGGKYVPQTLMYALSDLESSFKSLAGDQDFQKELDGILRDYVGRESLLYFAERLTEKVLFINEVKQE